MPNDENCQHKKCEGRKQQKERQLIVRNLQALYCFLVHFLEELIHQDHIVDHCEEKKSVKTAVSLDIEQADPPVNEIHTFPKILYR